MTEDKIIDISLDDPGSGLYLFSSNGPPVWVKTRELFELYGELLQDEIAQRLSQSHSGGSDV